MIWRFINLEWKQFFRSSHWQKSIAINILMIFVAVYFIVVFLVLGFALYAILTELFPDTDPFVKLNGFIFYWILFDLLIRFFFQKLPVMSVKPLLVLPVKRGKAVHYVLRKSSLHFLNILPLFAIIPFSVILIGKGQPWIQVVVWVVLMLVVTQINNFLNFVIETYSSATELSFLPIIVLAGGLFAINYFGLLALSDMLGSALLTVTEQPLYLMAPLLLMIGLYQLNFRLLIDKLYLDHSMRSKTREAKGDNLEWTRMFGDIAPFMQLDIRLMLRNKRPRSSLFILLIGLLYGLFFYPNPIYQDMEWLFIFIGIFVTGIFLISFGQFIPAWDGSYYNFLMSQNIRYEKYLKSKFILMVASVVVMFVLSIPYVYFGWKILLVHFVAALYNIGVNSHVIMFAGHFNRKSVKLDQRAAFNYQGTGAVQWLLGIPLMILPMIIFGLLYYFINFQTAVSVIGLLGLTGIVLHQRIMQNIISKYEQVKHKMIAAFAQES